MRAFQTKFPTTNYLNENLIKKFFRCIDLNYKYKVVVICELKKLSIDLDTLFLKCHKHEIKLKSVCRRKRKKVTLKIEDTK